MRVLPRCCCSWTPRALKSLTCVWASSQNCVWPSSQNCVWPSSQNCVWASSQNCVWALKSLTCVGLKSKLCLGPQVIDLCGPQVKIVCGPSSHWPVCGPQQGSTQSRAPSAAAQTAQSPGLALLGCLECPPAARRLPLAAGGQGLESWIQPIILIGEYLFHCRLLIWGPWQCKS